MRESNQFKVVFTTCTSMKGLSKRIKAIPGVLHVIMRTDHAYVTVDRTLDIAGIRAEVERRVAGRPSPPPAAGS